MTSLTLLHGFTGSPESMREIVPFGVRYRCPEILGHGAKSLASDFHGEVARLLAAIASPTHVVGYSMGGRLALAMAIAAPNKFLSLTLVAASPGILSQPERSARARSDQGLASKIRKRGLDWFVKHWESIDFWHSQRGLGEPRLARQRAIRASHSANELANSLELLGQGSMPALWDELEALRMPTRIISGELDSKYSELGQMMKAKISRAEHHVAKGVGHNVVLEAPGFVRTRLALGVSHD